MEKLYAPSDDRLDGKVAIVAGAGAAEGGVGNGRAAAILFAKAGSRVFCVDRDLDRAIETADIIGSDVGEAFAYQADTTKETECQAIGGYQ